MRRVALLALVVAACNNPQVEHPSGPHDKFFYPTGLWVLDHRLVVVSSNADLTYASDTGGTVIAVAPPANPADPVPVTGAVNIQSFAGELGVLDATACPAIAQTLAEKNLGALAFVPTRGTNLAYAVGIGNDGSLTCPDCAIGVGSNDRGDPFAVGIACDDASTPGGPKVARAYLGYLRSSLGQAWLTQIDLMKDPSDPLYVQHQVWDAGTLKAFAYDPTRRRLYFTRSVTGVPETLRYVDLAYGPPTADLPDGVPCPIGLYYKDGGCASGTTASGALPPGVELRGIALAHVPPGTEASTTRRVYLTGRIYDAAAAATAGYAIGDYDGLLIVADLTTTTAGTLQLDIVQQFPIGYGAAYVRVLPYRAGKRDVVAALAIDDGSLWIYDDETGTRTAINRNPVTGTPLLGDGPFGLAVDPAAVAGNVSSNEARLYVGSFRQHWVTPVNVPLDDPESAYIPETAQGELVRIVGGVLP